ncbi:MAG: hypothetical protein D6795_00085, partial [Deltaproteobacteria bacterium]
MATMLLIAAAAPARAGLTLADPDGYNVTTLRGLDGPNTVIQGRGDDFGTFLYIGEYRTVGADDGR